MWTADKPASLNGIKILGTPLGSPEFVKKHGRARMDEERSLLDHLPQLQDLQSAWLLLSMSAVPRANHLLRVVPPSQSAEYATAHDDAVWQTLVSLLALEGVSESDRHRARAIASLPARLGGIGLRSALRTRSAAFWAGWADALPVLKSRVPDLARAALTQLERGHQSGWATCREAATASASLQQASFDGLPTWQELWEGAVAPQPAEDDEETPWERGWQFHACRALENSFRQDRLFPLLDAPARALVRSQAGPGAGHWLRALPTEPAFVLPAHLCLVALRRRLRVPIGVAARYCEQRACGRRLDALGDHRAACAISGRLKKRATPLERCWARVFREARATVTENRMLRDTNLPGIRANDGRRLEVVAVGTPLWHGVPLGCDATLVSPLHADGSCWGRADVEDGVAIRRGELAKEDTYPELINSSDLRLVVLACEVGGRWSSTCVDVIRGLARHRAATEPSPLRQTARHAWRHRWWCLLSVTQQHALASSLLDMPVADYTLGGAQPLAVDIVLDTSHPAGVSRLPLRG